MTPAIAWCREHRTSVATRKRSINDGPRCRVVPADGHRARAELAESVALCCMYGMEYGVGRKLAWQRCMARAAFMNPRTTRATAGMIPGGMFGCSDEEPAKFHGAPSMGYFLNTHNCGNSAIMTIAREMTMDFTIWRRIKSKLFIRPTTLGVQPNSFMNNALIT